MFDPKKVQYGVKIFELATEIYPESSNLFDSLGEAYLLAEDMKSAKTAFEKSIQLFSGNENARKRLEELH